ncbi:exocyst complex component 3-like protein 2 [Periophthalmus magnuspinnatus]|uniref:exocyst complex component 3-like protein 2 n=1 Tax=Periophthalmus magnuspinnatus TaxID=409849 RepID=UPI00145AA133|nr:exocyst complex component 3-like protein 2 [Periophthalmus magnuspinnatus]
MPLLKDLRLRGGGPTLHNALVLRRMSLNITAHMNPFNDDGLDGDSQGWSPGSSLLDGDVPRDRNPFEDEEDENKANEGKRGGVNSKEGGSGGKGGGFKFVSPLRTLDKIRKSLRTSGRVKDGTPSPSESPGEKKKRGRRSSEGSLLRFAGRYRGSLSSKDCISNGDPGSEEDSQSRRLSLMKMVLGKHKRESGSERISQGPEEPEPEPEVVKPREPLSDSRPCAKVTTELVQILEEEEKRWMETLHVEEYTLPLTNTVIQRLEVDLERSASVNQSLGSRVAQCSLNGLADFFYSFQRKVELFHEGLQSGMFGDNEDGYVSKTIAQVNCCPPFRAFADRCSQSDPLHSEDSLKRASRSLDSVVQCGVRVLSERLYHCIKPLFERLVKRKWLSDTEPFEQIKNIIKENFKKYQRMESPPYQALVSEVHRRVLTEYLRSVMRGRLICTSAKMRRRTSQRLREEGDAMTELFTALDSPCRWLEGALSHLSEIIHLEDLPSIQMEVGVLAREYPDVRRKHVSAILNLRGLTRQTDRVEILNVLKDLESNQDSWDLPRDRALFSDVPVTSELHCINVGLSRLALTATSCFTTLRPKRKTTKRTRRDTNEDEGL